MFLSAHRGQYNIYNMSVYEMEYINIIIHKMPTKRSYIDSIEVVHPAHCRAGGRGVLINPIGDGDMRRLKSSLMASAALGCLSALSAVQQAQAQAEIMGGGATFPSVVYRQIM